MSEHPAPADGMTGLLLGFLDALRKDIQEALPGSCSFMHIKVLAIVDRMKEPSMSQVAEELKITSPGATMIADKLVESGELERLNDPADRRVVRLKIAAAGRQTLQRGIGLIRTSVEAKMALLTKAEQEKLASLLKKLI
ncbi:MAG: winged helix-turn-helix transcriptional regulator [Patescibacteria group bacterium]|nr:winged helix-turn-helix transcriptional regulator [Patescibacteria group bacterium]